VPVITISRQLGSLGDEVAQEIAARVGYRVVCRDLINQAAQRSGAPELALVTIDDLGLLGIKPSAKARRAYLHSVKEIMLELAEQGDVVIIGRAGQVILHDHPSALHIKVIAPQELRAARIAQQQDIHLEAARAQVTASDRTRKNHLRYYYHARWDDPQLYDLIINTARLEPLQAACLICQAMEQCITRITNAPSGTPASHE
jgi:cytidylate kinase